MGRRVAPEHSEPADPAPMPRLHRIGEVADEVGLSLRTIRYYEEMGLVEPSGRTPGGFRLYTDSDADRLRIVKHMKPLDFTIEEMRDLLLLRDRIAVGPVTPDDSDRLDLYATIVAHRVDTLRERLSIAEALGATLRRDAREARRRAATSL